MLETYEINAIDQLRAVADALRVQIIDLLQDHPMTVTQVGELMGLAPARVHYHVRELEKVGLLQLVEKREKGGVIEKYYQPIARDFTVSKELFLTAPHDDSIRVLGAMIEQLKNGFLRSFRAALEQQNEQPFLLEAQRLYLAPGELMLLARQVFELIKPYEQRRGIEGEQEVTAAVIAYPQAALQQPLAPANVVTTKDDRVVGSVRYSRSDLENAIAGEKRMNIHVTGLCTFASDVTADLIDRAVETFSLVGKLQASPDVRAALAKKRA